MFQWHLLDEIDPGTVVCIARNAWMQRRPDGRESQLGVLCGAWVSEGWASDSAGGFNNTDRAFFDDVLYAYDAVVGGRSLPVIDATPGANTSSCTRSTFTTWSHFGPARSAN